MAWYPGAVRKEITKWRTLISGPRGFVFHVAVSEASSLFGYFSGAQVCSHFYIRRDGTVEQYVDTRFRAPANYQGNPSLLSVETQGGVSNAQGEGWTAQQRQALAELSLWANQVHGIPLVPMANSKSSSKGIGYHRQGIDPWRVAGGEQWSTSRGKICPGNQKIAEIPGIIAVATGQGGSVTVPVDNGTPATGNGGAARDYLYVGDTGDAVREVQTLLTQAGFPTTVDGVFGKGTLASVRNYQASRNLVIDGYVGPATLNALRSGAPAVYVPPPAPAPQQTIVLKRGSTGQNVVTLQATLKTRYPSYAGKIVTDGIFGPATEAVVKEFQRRSGLEVDGIVGAKTQAALGLSFVQPGTPTPPAPTPPPAPVGPNLVVDGIFGPSTIKALQKVLGVTQDGIFGTQTKKALQTHVGTTADGVFGKNSNIALQKHLNARGEHLAVDGIWGSATTAGLQRVLNRNAC